MLPKALVNPKFSDSVQVERRGAAQAKQASSVTAATINTIRLCHSRAGVDQKAPRESLAGQYLKREVSVNAFFSFFFFFFCGMLGPRARMRNGRLCGKIL